MTHEAGIWIFGIITLICLSVWLLCRRSKAVEDVVDEIMLDIRKNALNQEQVDHLRSIAPFHYEPSDYQNANNKAWSDLTAQMPLLAPVKWIDKDDFADMYGETPRPLPKGWQGWEGGECPVPDSTMVVVMYICGYIDLPERADNLLWSHYGNPCDIVAWRVA